MKLNEGLLGGVHVALERGLVLKRVCNVHHLVEQLVVREERQVALDLGLDGERCENFSFVAIFSLLHLGTDIADPAQLEDVKVGLADGFSEDFGTLPEEFALLFKGSLSAALGELHNVVEDLAAHLGQLLVVPHLFHLLDVGSVDVLQLLVLSLVHRDQQLVDVAQLVTLVSLLRLSLFNLVVKLVKLLLNNVLLVLDLLRTDETDETFECLKERGRHPTLGWKTKRGETYSFGF